MAIPGRLELPTYGLGNRRSIRLSYGTANPASVARVFNANIRRSACSPASEQHQPA
jgi:hypothetical protein